MNDLNERNFMQLNNLPITKADIKAAIPELLDEIMSVQKLKKDTSKINFGQIQKLMFERQQAKLLDTLGYDQESKLIKEFFGLGDYDLFDSYAGMMVTHVMGENIKSVDQIICEIFETKTTDIKWYK